LFFHDLPWRAKKKNRLVKGSHLPWLLFEAVWKNHLG
jgi:hypothetical protein